MFDAILENVASRSGISLDKARELLAAVTALIFHPGSGGLQGFLDRLRSSLSMVEEILDVPRADRGDRDPLLAARMRLTGKALREMRRVLRPGGTAVIIDLRRDVPMEEIRRYVDGLHLNLLNRWFTLLTFRFMLLKRAYTKEELEGMLARAGFAKTEVQINEIGMEAQAQR